MHVQVLLRSLIILSLLSSFGVCGTVVFENTFAPHRGGRFSSIGGYDSQISDDFMLTQPIIANRISWTGSHLIHRNISPFRLQFYVDHNGHPDTTPLFDIDLGDIRGRDTGFTYATRAALLYTTAIPEVALDSGTRYWISIGITDSERFSNKWIWLPSRTMATGNLAISYRDGDFDEWRKTHFGPGSYRANQAFSISGIIVPEPTGIIFAATLAALFMLRRHRPPWETA